MTLESNSNEVKKKSPNPGTLMTGLVIGGLLLAFGIHFYVNRNDSPPTISSAVDGLPGAAAATRAAPDLPVMTIDGRRLTLSQLRGKVVMLDFWATWCPPCRQEIPHLVRLAQRYGPKGLEVVGLTIENPQTDTEKVRLFMQRYGINYTVGFATDELFSAYIGPGQQPIPQTLLFDRQGQLITHMVGFNPKLDPQRLESIITRLL
jgi:cytochrome c biogenesis protein CcmG/thiol:disulfide interchange protein DsbE